MYAITVNLVSFSFSEKMKTSLFVSAQRHNLSCYARLALQQTKKQITALRKIYAVEPAASIQRFK